MNVDRVPDADQAREQATFGMANLRMERTGLPFIVFISKKDDAQHDARIKVSPAPRVRLDRMSSYALRPFRLTGDQGLATAEEALLRRWVDTNLEVLVSYWDGRIEYTEDAIESLVALG